MKKVLVLLSSYNGEKYIEQQIRSIMCQETKYQVELLVRDDGSADGTCDAIKKLQKEFNGKIQLIEGTNVGCNKSFFELINNCQYADYYALSDQDDIWLPNKVEVAVNAIERENTIKPLLFSCTSLLVKDDLIPFGKTREKLREFTIFNTAIQNICPGHNQFFNNELRKLLMDVDGSQVYVYDLWITNIAMLFGSIIFLNDPLTLYRQHINNQMGTHPSRIGKIFESIHHTMLGDGGDIKKQDRYFLDRYFDELCSIGANVEIEEFLNTNNIRSRISFGFRTKLYRQSKFETLLFKFAVLIGAI